MNNTHYYDGKWEIKIPDIKVNHDDFIKCIDEINLFFKCCQVYKVSKLVTTDLENNWDPSNNISFEYLLTFVWNKVKNNSDLIPLFKEQYTDILKGTCSQGRTTRMYQIYVLLS